ncbi:MAG: hypothetical protein QXU69_08960 [Thermofilaceae archaeon]
MEETVETLKKALEEGRLLELLHEAIDEVIDYDEFSDIEIARLGKYFVVHNLHSPDAPSIVKIFENQREAMEEFDEWTKSYAVEELAFSIASFVRQHGHADTFDVAVDAKTYVKCMDCGAVKCIDVVKVGERHGRARELLRLALEKVNKWLGVKFLE